MCPMTSAKKNQSDISKQTIGTTSEINQSAVTDILKLFTFRNV